MAGKESTYEYITGVVDCGQLSIEYKLKGATNSQAMSHDDDIDDWGDDEIKDAIVGALCLEPEERALIKIEYA